MTRSARVLPLLGLCVLLGCGGDDDIGASATPTASMAPTAMATATAPPAFTATRPPTATVRTPAPNTPTPTRTATGIPTGTATATVRSPIPTATPDPLAPEITFFGVARADDIIQETNLFDAQGRPIYERLLGQGLTLIIEAGRGMGSAQPGVDAYDPDGNPPDLQLLVSRPLGDGSPEVCDYDIYDSSVTGGVPATQPLEFSEDPSVVGAMNDLGCRVNDGAGRPRARTRPINACTQMNGVFDFVDPSTQAQFCLPIARDWAFPAGDTIVAARARSTAGSVSAPQEIVVRVLRRDTNACDGLGERIFTLARPDSMLLSSAGEGDVSVGPWLEGPLHLCAGAQLVDGAYALALVDDAVFGFRLVDDSVLCVSLRARDSAGMLDCNGGSSHDVLAIQDLPASPTLQVGLGDDAGPGAATLTATLSVIGLPAGSSAADCESLSYEGGLRTALTTAHAAAVLTNPIDGTDASIELTGTNFDCDRWTETDSSGTFVLAFPAAGTRAGNTVNAFVLAD